MQSHPLRTLLVLGIVSQIGLIGPLVLDGAAVVVCLSAAILPLVVACWPWLAALRRGREAASKKQRRLPERRRL